MIRFKEKIQALKKENQRLFPSLTSNGHPVLKIKKQLTEDELKKIIQQYSVFSYEAIHMLLDAMIRCHTWPILCNELQENIEEEKGKFTRGVPHLEIMRQGYLQELRIDTTDVTPLNVTAEFISKMKKTFRGHNVPFLCGALMALEGTAIEEFCIMDQIVNDYCRKAKIPTSELILTKEYIEGHKDFEIGHESHLIESASSYVDENNYSDVKEGYTTVCFLISNWWNGLAMEVEPKITSDELYPVN